MIFGNETFAGRNDPNHLASGDPFDLVTGSDLELIRDRLGYRNLVFGCHLRHVLTLARIESLLKLFGVRTAHLNPVLPERPPIDNAT